MMKDSRLTKEDVSRREKRKKLLAWQGEQLKRFKPFVLVRIKK